MDGNNNISNNIMADNTFTLNNKTYPIISGGRVNQRLIGDVLQYWRDNPRNRNTIINQLLIPNGFGIVGDRFYNLNTVRGQNAYEDARARSTLENRQRKQILKQQARYRKFENKIRLARAKRKKELIVKPFKTTSVNLNGGRKYTFVYGRNPNLSPREQFKKIMESLKYLDIWDAKYQFIKSPFGPSLPLDSLMGQNSLHSSFHTRQNIGQAYNQLTQVQAQLEEEYDEDFLDTDTEEDTDEDEDDTDEEDDGAGVGLQPPPPPPPPPQTTQQIVESWVKTLIVQVIVRYSRLMGQGGNGRSTEMANKTWMIIDKSAKKNCFWNCLAVSNLFSKRANENDNAFKLRLDAMMASEDRLLAKIKDNAKNLKRSANPSVKRFTDDKVIQDLVDWRYSLQNQSPYKIQVYNNIFAKYKLFVPSEASEEEVKKMRLIEIQYIKNHFVPLVRWKDIPINRLDTQATIEEVVNENHNNNEDCHLIKKFKSTPKPMNKYIATYDIEATPNGNNGIFKPFCVAFAWNYPVFNHEEEISGWTKKVKHWYGWDCLKQFGEFLEINLDMFKDYTLYAHNNGKFDMILTFNDWILSNNCGMKVNTDNFIVLNSAYIGVELYKDDNAIYFKDSLKMLPMGLSKLGKEFSVEHQKLEDVVLPDGRRVNIDHDQITVDNVFDYDVKHSQIIYCEHDCLCLLEVLNQFTEDVYKSTNLNITTCFTGASLSKKHYFTNYYNMFKTPIYTLSKPIDAFIRKSYCGGRNEAMFIGKYDKKVYYYDFTSLYPDVGRMPVPYGKPKHLTGEVLELLTQNPAHIPFGFYKVLVKSKKYDAVPLHCEKDGKLIFAHYEDWSELIVFSEEIKYGYKKKLYDYKFIEGYEFKRSRFLKQFFQDGFEKKGTAKAEGKSGLAQVYKIIINSGYGFWGLNTLGKEGKGRDGVSLYKGDSMDFWEAYEKNDIVNVNKNGDYLMVRENKELEIRDFNVAIASAITSYARLKLYTFIRAIKQKGGNVLYLDTDSCICDISMKAHEDLMLKFCWDGDGSELGSMKNEADDEVKATFKKKYGDEWLEKYNHQEQLDGGDFHWDKFIGGGCKQYALQKTCFDGSVIEICKMKGFKKDKNNKIKYKDFERLCSAYVKEKFLERKYVNMTSMARKKKIKNKIKDELITQQQVQFVSPLYYHMSEDVGYTVEKKEVEKWFKIGYTKGIIQDDGWVKPLVF
tara:strand:+ start:1837 stop:5442 length:3606 start_codon:yes stop_codon:yes gene_type:complete